MPHDFERTAAAMVVGTEKAIAAAVAPLLKRIEVLEARPAPIDGKDGRDGIDGTNGKDGVGVAGALIDRSGVLVLTLSDGTQRDLGPVVGRDGSDGLNGADGLPGEPGKDGFSLDDFDVNPGEDGRTVIMSFGQGEQRFETELKFPVVIDKGVFKAGEEYELGDGCTWGGSYWIAQSKTNAKPDGPDSGWRLAVKRGRDGKDAK